MCGTVLLFQENPCLTCHSQGGSNTWGNALWTFLPFILEPLSGFIFSVKLSQLSSFSFEPCLFPISLLIIVAFLSSLLCWVIMHSSAL